MERVLAANPDRYTDVNTAAVMDHASVILASLAITTEVNTDLAYDRKAQARADKQLSFQEKEASATAQHQPNSAEDSVAIIQQLRADVEQLKKGQNRQGRKERETSTEASSIQTTFWTKEETRPRISAQEVKWRQYSSRHSTRQELGSVTSSSPRNNEQAAADRQAHLPLQ